MCSLIWSNNWKTINLFWFCFVLFWFFTFSFFFFLSSVLDTIRKIDHMATSCDRITMGGTKMLQALVFRARIGLGFLLTPQRNGMVSLILVFEIGSFHTCSETHCCRLCWGNKRAGWSETEQNHIWIQNNLSFYNIFSSSMPHDDSLNLDVFLKLMLSVEQLTL